MMVRVLALLLVLTCPFPALAEMKIDVSEDVINVTTGFNGTSITVFGEQSDAGQVVVVVEGPNRTYTTRRKGRTLGLWTNVDSREIKNVPGYYEVAASTPIAVIASDATLAQHHIGLNNLPMNVSGRANAKTEAFREAFIQSQKDRALYVGETRPLDYISPTLFKAKFSLPAIVPSGRYGVYAYLFRDGQLVEQDQTRFEVKPVGLSADMRRFAHSNGLLYGLAAVMIAVFAGWLATVLLKRE